MSNKLGCLDYQVEKPEQMKKMKDQREEQKKKGSKNCLKEITTIVTIALKLSVCSSFLFFLVFEAQKLKASINFSVKSYSVH